MLLCMYFCPQTPQLCCSHAQLIKSPFTYYSHLSCTVPCHHCSSDCSSDLTRVDPHSGSWHMHCAYAYTLTFHGSLPFIVHSTLALKSLVHQYKANTTQPGVPGSICIELGPPPLRQSSLMVSCLFRLRCTVLAPSPPFPDLHLPCTPLSSQLQVAHQLTEYCRVAHLPWLSQLLLQNPSSSLYSDDFEEDPKMANKLCCNACGSMEHYAQENV